jgi:1,4-dihydroxy-2-naphthoate polyprenyltransferase
VNQWQLYIMDSLKFKAWVNAARLRTLPLALSSSLMGSFAAYQDGRFKWNVFGLALLTTLFLQILSNLANDYGDSVNGADNAERVGPARAVQSGKISAYDMKRAVVITSVLAFISGILLIGAGVGYSNWLPWVVFLLVGLLAIAAAILYTAGSNPYGYKGFGDLFVFLFFGITAVVGTYYLHTENLRALVLLPAVTIGFLSTAVLNLNNMRDVEGDARSGKRTMVVLMGSSYAKIYHTFMVVGALVAITTWSVWHFESIWQFLFLLAIPLFLRHLLVVFRNKVPAALDPQLKILALSTFVLVLLFGTGVLLS